MEQSKNEPELLAALTALYEAVLGQLTLAMATPDLVQALENAERLLWAAADHSTEPGDARG
jgi:hypothetical protein